MCLLDWCMVVPLRVLVEEQGEKSGKRLIRTVFKALQTASCGKSSLLRHRTTHSYTLLDLKSTDFDPDLELKQTDKQLGSSLKLQASDKNKPNNNGSATDKAISLAAQIVLTHLTNHLGHFPLKEGPCVLSSQLCEFHDVQVTEDGVAKQLDDLSPHLFSSPNVQFLIYNNSCLMSIIEIPSNTDGDEVTMTSQSSRDVRIIVRDEGGKYAWNATLLHGTKDVRQQLKPVKVKSTPANEDTQDTATTLNENVEEISENQPIQLSSIQDPDLPGKPDKLDRLLRYISMSSPECRINFLDLNVPAKVPSYLTQEMQDSMVQATTNRQKKLMEKVRKQDLLESSRAKPCLPPPPTSDESSSKFQQARMLLSQMGFLSRESRDRVELLKKNERLLRDLRNIDNAKCRETHKIAVLYIGEGQTDKQSVLSNQCGSELYEKFVAGLGWEVNLENHVGFHGRLKNDKLCGKSAPYYATSNIEVIFHVATRFASSDEKGRHTKLKHIGNDEVHIVWSECNQQYQPKHIIPTDFADVVIVIYPIVHNLYTIEIIKKPEVPNFGPLYSGAIVNARILPVLVRETAINAGRAQRRSITYYQHYYETRAGYLKSIIDEYSCDSTFENFASSLFNPNMSGANTNNNNNNRLFNYPITAEKSQQKLTASLSSSNQSNSSNEKPQIIITQPELL